MRLPVARPLGIGLSVAILSALCHVPPVAAQTTPELPRLSPRARVEQGVGVAKFAVDYSSPGVKGRKVWGALVPYGEVWRTGADATTTLEAGADFTFGGVAVPAGSYALLSIPGEKEWTVILNAKTDLMGTRGYSETDDVARVKVRPEKAPARERLAFSFVDTEDTSTRLVLEWEQLRISVPIEVDTTALALANIEAALAGAWRPHFESARYLLRSGGDLAQALTYIDTSIAVQPTWWNAWVRAEILAKLDRKPEAVVSAKRAQELGADDVIYRDFFAANVEKAIADWQ